MRFSERMDDFTNSVLAPAKTHVFSGWLFLRLLGCTYAVAFVSLAVQVRGLSGRNGIAPACEFIEEQRAGSGARRFWAAPSLFWLNCSDWMLVSFCWIGVALSLLLIVGFIPVL